MMMGIDGDIFTCMLLGEEEYRREEDIRKPANLTSESGAWIQTFDRT